MAPSLEVEHSPAMSGLSSKDISGPGTFTSAVRFDPNKHLAYSPPPSTWMMEDLAHQPTELSSVAHTEPFPLLSHEGVLAHRREIFSKGVRTVIYLFLL